MVSLQHEYGIFGGRAGSHILALLRELRMPVVTTLHTILRDPNSGQRLGHIHITPYRDAAQITSGTLAYTLGAGKAIISTPYWYAEEMLAEERGTLVPFNDPQALAGQVIELLGNESKRHILPRLSSRSSHWVNALGNCLRSNWTTCAASRMTQAYCNMPSSSFPIIVKVTPPTITPYVSIMALRIPVLPWPRPVFAPCWSG